MNSVTIRLVEDFNPNPFGRYREDGERSAQVFREKHLMPAVLEYDRVVVDLSGYNYYGSSFLEETFGGLVRAGISKQELERKLDIKHDQLPSIVFAARDYINRASLQATVEK